MSNEPRTEAGRQAVRLRGLFGGETAERAAAWVVKIEDEARARLDGDDRRWEGFYTPDRPHPWDQHDDSCDCHIGICSKCGCTNEAEARAEIDVEPTDTIDDEYQVEPPDPAIWEHVPVTSWPLAASRDATDSTADHTNRAPDRPPRAQNIIG